MASVSSKPRTSRLLVATTAAAIAAGTAAAYYAWLLRQRRRRRVLDDVCDAHRIHADAGFERLAMRVRGVSEGRLRLINTADRGRCLVAAQDLPAGTRIRDEPVAPHGSARGLHVGSIVNLHLKEAEHFSSSDLLAAIDFLASLAKSLATGENSSENAAIWAMYRFEGEVEPVPMIRRWLPHINSGLAREVSLEILETAWHHVVPNWRRLVSSTPYGGWVENFEGSVQLVWGHETICGLWLLMALCEHSCNPSCALVHDAQDLWITTLRPVREGEAVTTSYLNVEGLCQDVKTRRKELRDAWRFTCACSRCAAELVACPRLAWRRPEKESEFSTGSFQALLQRWRSPPSELESQRLEYCNDLREARAVASKLQNGAAEPTTQSLLLLAAIFTPEGQEREEVCRELLDMCQRLQGDASAMSERARGLLEDPSGLLHQASSEGHALLAADGRESATETGQDGEAAARRAIRVLYRRYLVSRTWPRQRTGSGDAYFASGVAAMKRTAKSVARM